MKPAAPVRRTFTQLIDSEGVGLHTRIGREADRHALILRLFEQCVKSGGPFTATDTSGRPSTLTRMLPCPPVTRCTFLA